MPLTISSNDWAKRTDRFFTTGRSALLQQIDADLDTYWNENNAHGPTSVEAENALTKLRTAIDAWMQGRGTKADGNIDSTRDSKGIVTRLLNEVDGELTAIANGRGGAQAQQGHATAPSQPDPKKDPAAYAAWSRQVATQANPERDEGNRYAKKNGRFERVIFTQEQSNSCTCACACTYASLLSDAALKEEVLRAEVDAVLGRHHDFQLSGMLLDTIARALVRLHIDAKHVPTASFADLAAGLRKATTTTPVLFAVSWDPGPGAHAVICTGPGTVQAGDGQSYPGFEIMDPWPDHSHPTMYDDGTYLVWNRSSQAWAKGIAEPIFGYIWGKRGRV